MQGKHTPQRGFTLIEMSIVLVIIGLIVGAILTGRDLIRASEVRATVTQIEKYNTAVNTFRGKYGYLPGDIKDPDASNFGFQARGQYAGEGDGNGQIEGVGTNAPNSNAGNQQVTGETAVFWVDLSTAQQIPETFNTATPTAVPGAITGTAIGNYLPAPKLGSGNYIYVYSGSYLGGSYSQNGINYFGLSQITQMGGMVCENCVNSNVSLTVAEAYSIDKKIDDGLPQWGNVTALYLDHTISWAGIDSTDNTGPYTSAVPGDTTTCFDNGNTNGVQQHYSIEINNGNGLNCALSFKFQ